MRKDWSHLEGDRIRSNGHYKTDTGDQFGAFSHLLPSGVTLLMIVSSGDPSVEDETGEWEHVSVHAQEPTLEGKIRQRTPTWGEMHHVKSLFWEPGECVVQFHPPEANYVNTHDHVLHLWRHINKEIPQPPLICV